MLDALTARFGAGHVKASVSVDADTKPALWLSRLDALFPLMSLPGAELKLDGAKVELSGAAAAPKSGWLERIRTALGESFQVNVFDPDRAVADASASFAGALPPLLAADAPCAADEIARALDLQVINFARSSAQVPQGARANLGQTARVLIQCASNGKPARLEIAGYSDNVGNAAAKLELSKERAEAVRAFLVRAGVAADTLTARGYGDAHPVADNATASGRFANRRIEFVDQTQLPQ